MERKWANTITTSRLNKTDIAGDQRGSAHTVITMAYPTSEVDVEEDDVYESKMQERREDKRAKICSMRIPHIGQWLVSSLVA